MIPKGEPGKTINPPSQTEAILFTDFKEATKNGEMIHENTWFIPTPTEYFKIIDEKNIEISKGIYEIIMSGLIKNADSTHGAEVYLQTNNKDAIKDLTFELPNNSEKQTYFSQDIIFRLEEDTTLQSIVNITGDNDTSNITISNVTLILKKIHE